MPTGEPVAPGVYPVEGTTVHGFKLSTILLVAFVGWMIWRNRKMFGKGSGW